jgi:hypothetical protein
VGCATKRVDESAAVEIQEGCTSVISRCSRRGEQVEGRRGNGEFGSASTANVPGACSLERNGLMRDTMAGAILLDSLSTCDAPHQPSERVGREGYPLGLQKRKG